MGAEQRVHRAGDRNGLTMHSEEVLGEIAEVGIRLL